MEQLELMERIAENALSFSAKHQAILKDVMTARAGEDRTLFGKTGWTTAPNPDIGW